VQLVCGLARLDGRRGEAAGEGATLEEGSDSEGRWRGLAATQADGDDSRGNAEFRRRIG